MNSKHVSGRDAAKAFIQLVAVELAKLATEALYSSRTAKSDLQQLTGLPVEIKADDNQKITFIVDVPEYWGLPSSTKPEEMTDAAKNARYQARLDVAKRDIYNHIRGLSEYGSVPEARVIEVLKALGYTALPSESTTISVIVSSDNYVGGKRSTSFTLPGHVDRDEITAKIKDAFGAEDIFRSKLQELFPGTDFGSGVSVGVSHRSEWPVYEG